MNETVYIAGPLFTDAERAFNARVRDALSTHYNVFLPQEDGALVLDLIRCGMSPEAAKVEVFSNDVRAIEKATTILIILDGRTIDEGAAFELGVAFALGKICWALKTDIRQLLPIGDNPMIEGAVTKVFRSIEALREYVDTIHSRSVKIQVADVAR